MGNFPLPRLITWGCIPFRWRLVADWLLLQHHRCRTHRGEDAGNAQGAGADWHHVPWFFATGVNAVALLGPEKRCWCFSGLDHSISTHIHTHTHIISHTHTCVCIYIMIYGTHTDIYIYIYVNTGTQFLIHCRLRSTAWGRSTHHGISTPSVMVRDVGGEFDAIAGPVKSETRLPLPITLCRCQLLECLAEEKKVGVAANTKSTTLIQWKRHTWSDSHSFLKSRFYIFLDCRTEKSILVSLDPTTSFKQWTGQPTEVYILDEITTDRSFLCALWLAHWVFPWGNVRSRYSRNCNRSSRWTGSSEYFWHGPCYRFKAGFGSLCQRGPAAFLAARIWREGCAARLQTCCGMLCGAQNACLK